MLERPETSTSGKASRMMPPLTRRDIIWRRTDRFSGQERRQFLSLFARVFGKDMDVGSFERKYLHTPLGYSHHGLMVAGDSLVGAYNIIPYVYNYFGTSRLFGLSVDTMVASEHRGGPFNLVKMANLTCERARQDGIAFVYGFPNQNACQFTRRVLRWCDMGELDFYALPINVGALCPRLKWANAVFRLAARLLPRLPAMRRQQSVPCGIEKTCDLRFVEHRYGSQHRVINLSGGGTCVCCLHAEDTGVRAFYLIDVVPLTPALFAEAVRAACAAAVGHADIVLYVGRLAFRPAGLLRVPPAQRPRKVIMCGKLLDPGLVDERVLAIENWNVNLSNFDVR